MMFKIMGSWILNNVVLTSAIVIFSLMLTMIASNALWYQSGQHSSPMFQTRDGKSADSDMVTNSVRTRSAANKPATGARNDAQQYDAELVAELQRGLAKHGLYTSTIDGLMGRNTQAAIISFQSRYGMKVTGEVSVKLLTQVLQIQPQQRSQEVATAQASKTLEKVKPDWVSYKAIPTPRPHRADTQLQQTQTATLKPAATTEILAPVRQVKAVDIKPTPKPEVKPVTVQTQSVKSIGDIVDTAVNQASTTANNVASNSSDIQGTGIQARLTKPLVAKIQQGLRNYGISDVDVDGQINEKTTTAIRYFQRAHKMEIDGVPSPTLLNKMKALGTFNG